MMKNKIEEFKISKCGACNKPHILKVDVYRNIKDNNLNQDVRVPEFKKVYLNIICPVNGVTFKQAIFIKEDSFSRVVKLCKVDL